MIPMSAYLLYEWKNLLQVQVHVSLRLSFQGEQNMKLWKTVYEMADVIVPWSTLFPCKWDPPV